MQVALEFRQFSTDNQLQRLVAGNGRSRRREVDYKFEPFGEWRKNNFAIYAKFGEFEGAILSASILAPLDDKEQEAKAEGQIDRSIEVRAAQAYEQATGISIAGPFDRDVTLKTGSLGAPFKAMRECIDELLTHWGIDAAAHKTLSRTAQPRNMRALAAAVQSDYPGTALRAGMPAILRVRLAIDAAGSVTVCRMQLQYAEPEFERAACQNLKRARFDPALDKDGMPIASYWTTAIYYSIG
jgi:outer membrane biosynthesis protein TonB